MKDVRDNKQGHVTGLSNHNEVVLQMAMVRNRPAGCRLCAVIDTATLTYYAVDIPFLKFVVTIQGIWIHGNVQYSRYFSCIVEAN